MYIVGYIDDEKDMLDDYKKRLLRRDIELKIAPEGKYEDIMKWIVDDHIECMIIDYKLGERYEFDGNALFTFLNDELPGLPCIILTNFPDSSIEQNDVVKNCIFDRADLDSTQGKFDYLCEIIKQNTEVFKSNIKKYNDKFNELYQKKKQENITEDEEEQLVSVYTKLRNHGEVDCIPAELLKSDLEKKLDSAISKLDMLLNE